jgi:hypothetical protein
MIPGMYHNSLHHAPGVSPLSYMYYTRVQQCHIPRQGYLPEVEREEGRELHQHRDQGGGAVVVDRQAAAAAYAGFAQFRSVSSICSVFAVFACQQYAQSSYVLSYILGAVVVDRQATAAVLAILAALVGLVCHHQQQSYP